MSSDDKQRDDVAAFLKRFDQLPDTAIATTRQTRAVLPMSERSLRYHPNLPRRYISERLYGYAVGDIKKVLAGLLKSA